MKYLYITDEDGEISVVYELEKPTKYLKHYLQRAKEAIIERTKNDKQITITELQDA